jgi:Tfp pilus assembly protein PilE
MHAARKVWADRKALVMSRDDAGVADPAIVMITIVVLVVLALAGMFIGKGFVEQARDTNAQSDLERVASSQEFYAAEESGYTDKLSKLQAGGISFTVSKDVSIKIASTKTGWIASATHKASGNTFYRSSTRSETFQSIGGTVAALPTAASAPAAPAEGTTEATTAVLPTGLAWSSVEQSKTVAP